MADETVERRVIQLEIVAQGLEQANQRLASLERQAKASADVLQNLQGSFQNLKTAAETVAGALGAQMFAQMIQGSIDAQAQLLYMAQKTGTTVTALSALQQQAQEVGVPMETVGKSMGFFANSLVLAQRGSIMQQLAFQQLGLSAKDLMNNEGGLQASLVIVAKALENVENPALRVALAKQILGRAGQDLLPLLQRLSEEGGKEALVNEQQAARAAEYKAQLADLHDVQDKVFINLTQGMLPSLQAFVKTLTESATGTDGFATKIQKLADDGTLKQWAIGVGFAIAAAIDMVRGLVTAFEFAGMGLHLLGDLTVDIFETMADAVKGFYDGLDGLSEILQGIGLIMSGQLTAGADLVKQGWEDMKTAGKASWDGMKDAIGRAGAEITDFSNQTDKLKADFAKGSFTDAFSKNLDSFVDKQYKVKQSTGAANVEVQHQKDALESLSAGLVKANAALQAQITNYTLYGTALKSTAQQELAAQLVEMKENGTLDDMIKKKGGDVVEAEIKHAKSLAAEKDALTEELKILQDLAAADKKSVDDYGARVQTIVDEIQKEKDKLATYGSLTSAVTDYAIAQLEAKKATAEQYDASQDVVAALQMQIDKLKELAGLQKEEESIKEKVNAWQELAKDGADFFTELATKGKSAFASLKQMVADFAKQMINLFAQKFILNLAASAAGGTSTNLGGALLNAASNTGQNTLAGTALTAANEYGGSLIGASTFTGGVSSAVFGTSALTGAGDFVGTGLAGWAGNMALAAGATDTFAASVAAAVPVIGWIVAIGAILYSIFGSKGGGPKGGGFSAGTFNADSGIAVPGGFAPGVDTDNNRYYTPNQADSSIAQLIQQQGTSFQQTLRALGGTQSGPVTFALGYDKDPNGTSPNRVSAGASINGQAIYQARNVTAGRDDTDLQNEIQLQMERMMVSALKASNLPDDLAQIFNKVDVASATKDTLDALLAFATAISDLKTGLAIDPIKAAQEEANRTQEQQLQMQQTSLQQLSRAYDGTAKGAQSLVQATQQYQQSLVQLLAVYEKTKQQIDAMFGNTIRNIKFQSLDKQGQYGFLQNESADLLAQALKSTSVDQINQMAQQINQDINQAFSMLSPEQQAAQSSDFIARAQKANEELQQHLSDLQKGISDQGQDQIKQIKDIVTDAANKFADSAGGMKDAANSMNNAADKMNTTRVDVHVYDDRSSATASVNDGG